MWIFTLFQNPHFNSIELKIDYSKIQRIREQALIAKRENNLTWLKYIKDGLDTLGVWDRKKSSNSFLNNSFRRRS